jgi:phage terminase large subunit
MREIEFNRNWWLKWYWPHIDKIYRTEAHYGTRQSGKTHQIARKLIYHSFQDKKFNVVHARKQYNQIEGSTFKLLKDIVINYFPDDFIILKDHFQIINKHTGNWFRGLGMDKPEYAKSIEGANIAWLNEANQFTEDDYDYLDTTIRGDQNCDISMILDWNPEKRSHWLYDEHLKISKSENCALIKSTFWDNYLIDREGLHNKLLKIKSRGKDGEMRYKVWALGEWGTEDPDKMFAREYNSEIHFGKKFNDLYDSRLDLYFAWDFNVQNTCLAIQCPNDSTINVLKEYHILGYDLPMLCDLLQNDFKGHFYIINGDASGKNQSALTRGNETAYDIIRQCMNLSWEQFMVPAANPSHLNSRLLTNLIFKFMNVNISEECIELNNDLQSVEIDERGKLDTYKTKHPDRTHWLDPLRYHFNAHHNDKIELVQLNIGN